MQRSPSTISGFAALIVLGGVACADHEPRLERRGPPLPDSGTPSPSCPSDGAGGEGGAPATPVEFCQAEIVLRTVCQTCHANPPLHGAPFSLVTYEDTQKPFDSEKLRWERMREVVEANIMPIRLRDVPFRPLTCEEKTTLLGWLDECARPEGGTDCSAGDAELLSCEGGAGAPSN